MALKTSVDLKKGYKAKTLDPKVSPKHFDAERSEIWADVIERSPLDLRVEHIDIVAQYCQLVHHANKSQTPLKSGESRLLREYAIDLGMMPSGRKSATPVDGTKGAKEPNNTSAKPTQGWGRFSEPSRPKKKK